METREAQRDPTIVEGQLKKKKYKAHRWYSQHPVSFLKIKNSFSDLPSSPALFCSFGFSRGTLQRIPRDLNHQGITTPCLKIESAGAKIFYA